MTLLNTRAWIVGAAMAAVAAALAGCATPETVRGRNYIGPESPMMRAYPKAAMQQEKVGIVLLHCLMAPTRYLTDCEPAYSSTPGWGFEESAKVLVHDVVIKEDEAEMVRASRPGIAPGTAWVLMPVLFYFDEESEGRTRAMLAAADWDAARAFARERLKALGVPPIDLFPPAARAANKTAALMLSCLMTPERKLRDCQIAFNSTPGFGFEEMAMTIAGRVLLKTGEAADIARNSPGPVPGSGWILAPMYLYDTPTQRAATEALLTPEAREAARAFGRARVEKARAGGK